MKSLKGGGNSFEKIEEAIDYVNDRLPLDDACTAPMRPSTNPDPDHGSLTSRTLVSMQAPELKNVSDRNEVPIPSELISHCVATLLMIQVSSAPPTFYLFFCLYEIILILGVL